jgi:hypothetical protein
MYFTSDSMLLENQLPLIHGGAIRTAMDTKGLSGRHAGYLGGADAKGSGLLQRGRNGAALAAAACTKSAPESPAGPQPFASPMPQPRRSTTPPWATTLRRSSGSLDRRQRNSSSRVARRRTVRRFKAYSDDYDQMHRWGGFLQTGRDPCGVCEPLGLASGEAASGRHPARPGHDLVILRIKARIINLYCAETNTGEKE